ncbi:hypothetical protein HUB97_07505 [Halorubraceae archaeon YAN]|nr:hypothetical protein [Halorubraceae archaeon YAN]
MWESKRSFPAWIENAYDAVEKRSSEREYSLPREEAVLVIQATGDDLTEYEATHALEQLLSRGWIYEVDGEIRITER